MKKRTDFSGRRHNEYAALLLQYLLKQYLILQGTADPLSTIRGCIELMVAQLYISEDIGKGLKRLLNQITSTIL